MIPSNDMEKEENWNYYNKFPLSRQDLLFSPFEIIEMSIDNGKIAKLIRPFLTPIVKLMNKKST